MAEDDKTEETPEETPVEETPAEEPAAEAPAEEAPAEEAPAEEPAAEEAPAEEAEAPAEEPAAEEPAEQPAQLTKREQRTQARHLEASKRPARTSEERQAERDAERKRKAAQRRRRREKLKAARPSERGPAKTVSPVEHGPGRPKVRLGRVVSDKADKTITVKVDMARRHRRYEKIVRSGSTLHAHDERNEAHAGDLVRIVESRPLSRTKRWRLVEVLERAE